MAVGVKNIEAFAGLMSEEPARSQDRNIRIIDAVEVDDGASPIIDTENVLHGTVVCNRSISGNVRAFVCNGAPFQHCHRNCEDAAG